MRPIACRMLPLGAKTLGGLSSANSENCSINCCISNDCIYILYTFSILIFIFNYILPMDLLILLQQFLMNFRKSK
ncbi:hypothetical protein NMG60_11017395 [Bertholletia excelsa]